MVISNQHDQYKVNALIRGIMVFNIYRKDSI